MAFARSLCGVLVCAAATGCPGGASPTTTTTVTPAGSGASGGSATDAPPPVTPPPAAPVRVAACGGGQQDFVVGPPASYAARSTTGALTIGDLNGDKIVDLIVGSMDTSGAAQIGVMLGKGDGTFAAPVQYPLLAGGEVRSIAVTDFDTDEDIDIVTAGGSGMPQIFLNNGDGTFGEPVTLPVRVAPAIAGRTVVVRVEDIHGDAHPDVVTYAGGGFDVWHDSGHAQFVASVLPAIDRLEHGAGLTIADFDKDGRTDLAVAGSDHGAAVVVVQLGKRGGGDVFAAPVRYPVGATGTAAAVVTGDFDGNGKPDLAALFTSPSGGTIVVLYGKGDGTFGGAVTLAVPDAGDGATLAAGDLDGDGKTDLVASTTHGLAVYASTGKAFAAAGQVPIADVRAVAVGDLRGDKQLGLVATQAGGGVIAWPGSCR